MDHDRESRCSRSVPDVRPSGRNSTHGADWILISAFFHFRLYLLPAGAETKNNCSGRLVEAGVESGMEGTIRIGAGSGGQALKDSLVATAAFTTVRIYAAGSF